MIPTIQPKISLLSTELIQKIIDEALIILEKQGIFVENQDALHLLRDAGMKIDDSSQRVFITPKLVEESLASTPAVIKLYDRSGEKEFILGDDHVHFDPGSTAVTVLDQETKMQRKPVTNDLVRFTRLTDSMQNLHLQSTSIISTDIPESISDSYRMYICLQYSEKPIITGTFRVEGFKPMRDMLVAVRGSEEKLAEKPLAVFDACPSPPLKWSNLTAQSLVDSARAGIPSELISMGLTGATSPVTISGTLVQHVVESLSGVVICQLAEKGASVIFGGCPISFDMRKGTTPTGAIETLMIDSAYTQIAKYLKMPSHSYMGLSDSKLMDEQSGFETGIGVILAALSGVNVISGAGMLDFIRCQSESKLVIDNEICGMAYRLLDGIAQREEPIATHIFEGLTDKSQFLSLPHTRKWYRQEHTFPSQVVDRDNYEHWVSEGKKSVSDRADEEVERILRETPPALPGDEVVEKLKQVMTADAQNNNISSLPDLN